MKILITGGTGFIGSALASKLLDQGHRITIFTRSREKVEKRFADSVSALTDFKQMSSDDPFDAIVNLAGAPIFAGRWNDRRKKILRDSRIGLTRQLVETIATMPKKPQLLISGSAVGYYGNQGDTLLSEHSEAIPDFSHQLCKDWEEAALQAEQFGIRVCLIRTGLVLGADGGMLQRMLPLFRLGLGGQIGDGKQWMSWIHLRDWLAIAEAMLCAEQMSGAFNATAPNPVTNRQFTETLATVLKKPACLPIPGITLKILLGEMSELVLGSQRVLPDRLINQGFQFQFTDLHGALEEILS